jgi:hypothetical protein
VGPNLLPGVSAQHFHGRRRLETNEGCSLVGRVVERMGVKERQSADVGKVALAQRLRKRQGEIERALAQFFLASRPGGVQDPKHCRELSAAFAAVTSYNLDCIERGEDVSDPIPSAAIIQARRAAREGIKLDAFLVGVIAAQTMLNEFIFQEAHDLTGNSLSNLQGLQGSILLRFASELADEYNQEKGRLDESSARRQNALVERLLSGAPVADLEVGYTLEMWHTGLIASGTRAMDAARTLAEQLGTALMAVPRDGRTVWAWLGSNRKLPSCLVRDAADRGGVKANFSVGEPGRGLEGWRSTHFEAKAALAIAMYETQKVTCFGDVALEAIALQVPDLAQSLQAIYLAPLTENQRRWSALRQTLLAYFDSGRNASSAAVSLRVSRRTVENRLRFVERKLGRSLLNCGAELELALRLEDLKPAVSSLFPE